MAGPSLSHILDPPRPPSGPDLTSTPPPSFASSSTRRDGHHNNYSFQRNQSFHVNGASSSHSQQRPHAHAHTQSGPSVSAPVTTTRASPSTTSNSPTPLHHRPLPPSPSANSSGNATKHPSPTPPAGSNAYLDWRFRGQNHPRPHPHLGQPAEAASAPPPNSPLPQSTATATPAHAPATTAGTTTSANAPNAVTTTSTIAAIALAANGGRGGGPPPDLGPAPGHGPGSGSGPAAAVGAMTPGSAPSATPVTPASAAPSAPASHTGTNLYACRDCGRSYSRPEHLVRHVQTHTLGRRFVCDICQKSFARKDLLRRHVTNHDSDSSKKRRRNNAAGTASSPGAGRVSHACRPCAAARVKCDDEKPCKRCVSRKLTCVSSASETSSSAAVHHHRQSYLQPSSSTSPPTGEPSIASSGAAGATAPYHQQNQHQHHRASAGASNDGDRSVATSRDDSQSPASFTTTHQPRSLPAHVAAPASALPPSSLSAPPLASAASRDRDGQYPSLYSYRMPSRPDDRTSDLRPLTPEPCASAMDPNRQPFADFLRHVLHESAVDPGHPPAVQGLSVLDFCDALNLDMSEMDFHILDNWNLDGFGSTPGEDTSSQGDSSMDMSQMRQNLVRLWTNSAWTWDLKSKDGGYRDHRHASSVAGASESSQYSQSRIDRIVAERLEQSGRDQILAMALSTVQQNPAWARASASFPSVDVIDLLVHRFLSYTAHQTSEWIHFPTFRINAQWPEWIAMAAAWGAILTPVPALRRFGFALQDAVRIKIPERLEENTPSARDTGLIESLILLQDIGLWSGNRRKMEIAQSHLAIPITMMRYRSRFQRSSYPILAVDPADEGSVLEEKWRKWVERERWKRLVFYCFLRDAQCSMTTLTNPTISYAELTLPLPEARELWYARSAAEWKAEYLRRSTSQSRLGPSIGNLLHDAHLLTTNHPCVDLQLAVSAFLHGYWALILEYRRLSAVHRSGSYTSGTSGSQGLLLSSRHQELVKDLQSFQLMTSDWVDVTPKEHILVNTLLMNLHVSLDDLQLFAGKEGEDQARRVYPVLQQWASSSEARSAIWHAGQALRYAKAFPPGQLRDFYAVAVHHAILTLWAYGVIYRANHRQPTLPAPFSQEQIYLDDSDTTSMQRFINFGQGKPVIRGSAMRDSGTESPVEDVRACMGTAQEVLRSNFRDGADALPPMVENLCQLITQLGEAAWDIGLG